MLNYCIPKVYKYPHEYLSDSVINYLQLPIFYPYHQYNTHLLYTLASAFRGRLLWNPTPLNMPKLNFCLLCYRKLVFGSWYRLKHLFWLQWQSKNISNVVAAIILSSVVNNTELSCVHAPLQSQSFYFFALRKIRDFFRLVFWHAIFHFVRVFF